MGRGYLVTEACKLCGGLGRHGTEARIKVKVPAELPLEPSCALLEKATRATERRPRKLTVPWWTSTPCSKEGEVKIFFATFH